MHTKQSLVRHPVFLEFAFQTCQNTFLLRIRTCVTVKFAHKVRRHMHTLFIFWVQAFKNMVSVEPTRVVALKNPF